MSYPVSPFMAQRAFLNDDQYQAMYARSVEDPEGFWAEQADIFLDWTRGWGTVFEADLPAGRVRWFDGAVLNACYNCIDRHLPARADQTAIIWEGDDPGDDASITYRQLHDAVCRLANGLRSRGVSRGDRVCIYMPMIPEAAYAMLACARIGAVHSVVFGGFSPQSLKDRILDSDCQTVITADQGVRGGRTVPLKHNTIATRYLVPRGPAGSELVWTILGYADDDDRQTQIRLKQGNLIGPSGYISLEDGMVGSLVQKGIEGDKDKSSVMEMAGRSIETIVNSRASECGVRGFWTAYRALMGV